MLTSGALGSCVTALVKDGDLSSPMSATADLPGPVTWHPALSGLTPQVDESACRPAFWMESMWSGFVFNKDVERTQPLILRVALGNATGHVDAETVRFHASWLYGLEITYVTEDDTDALRVFWNDARTGYTKRGGPFEGVVDTDQVSLTYSKANIQLLHSYYRIQLWSSTHPELVLLHELGHVVGLGHVSNTGNIMNGDGAALGIHACSSWTLHHVHPAPVGWSLP